MLGFGVCFVIVIPSGIGESLAVWFELRITRITLTSVFCFRLSNFLRMLLRLEVKRRNAPLNSSAHSGFTRTARRFSFLERAIQSPKRSV
jgi:hypothetical protein